MKTRFALLTVLMMTPAVMLSACLSYPEKYPNPDSIVDVSDVVVTDTGDHGVVDVSDVEDDIADVSDVSDVSDVDAGDVVPFCVKDEPCDDKNPCTVEDTCDDAGLCVGRLVAECDDSLACTDDSCVDDGECEHPLKDGFCLVAGKCYALDELDVAGSGPCKACKPDVATDEMTDDDSLTCDDASACTTSDHCVSGVCTGTAAVCDDSKVCTTDSCVPATGCLNVDNTDECTPARCEALLFYPAAICAGGACPVAVGQNCDDGNPCTTDTCKASTGCSNVARNGQQCAAGRCELGTFYAPSICQADFCPPQDSTYCDDGNICTQDNCSPQGGCLTPPANGVTCGDARCEALIFFPKAICNASLCPTPVTQNCNDNNVCTNDSCTLTGCLNAANTLDCADTNLCTENDKCQNKLCKPGTQKNCDDGLACTIDSCTTSTGVCKHAHVGYCVIDNQCYQDGQADPNNPCRVCSSTMSPTAWVPGQNGYPCADYPNGAAECLGGECIYSCNLNLGDCDLGLENGCEANLLNDPDYCSDCFTDCGTQVCSWGVCADNCAGDLLLCANRCQDIKTSLDHCGGCNVPCHLDNAVETCSNGVCTLTRCDSGYVDVDHLKENGCECQNTGIEMCDGKDNDCNGVTDDVDAMMLQSDPDNCGLCGRICNEGDKSVYGFCRDAVCLSAPCGANEWDIDKKPLNVCEYYCVQSGVEVCGNAIDEDCSGVADDGC